jgi:hypothetical protein
MCRSTHLFNKQRINKQRIYYIVGKVLTDFPVCTSSRTVILAQ